MTNPTNQGGELKVCPGCGADRLDELQFACGTWKHLNEPDSFFRDSVVCLRSQLSAAKETIDKVRRWEYNNFPMGCRDVFPLNGKSRKALMDILKDGDCNDNNFTSKI